MSKNGKITWVTETRRLGDLEPWPENPRQLTEAQAERLEHSLTKFGYSQLVEIEPDGTFLDGHQRDELMKVMDDYGADALIEVRVASRKFTLEERKEYIAQKHQGATGEWDVDQMHNLYEFDELVDYGFDVSELEAWGFAPDDEEPPDDPGAQIDRAEELRELWGVEPGQLWRLGEHRLICGDCTDAEVVDRLMQGEKAGAVVTDPPYGIEREGIPNDDPEGLKELYDGCLANIPITDAVIIAFQSPRLFTVWLDVLKSRNQKFERMLWWYETSNTKPWRGFRMQGEAIVVSSKGKAKWFENISHPDTFNYEIISRDGHPTQKPLSLIEDLMVHTTKDVYDPFLGSGTTLIACERLNRKCRAVEISPAYCAVAIQRWVDMTGDQPELIDNMTPLKKDA